MENILFYAFAAIIVASASVVVFSKNVMHSAFSLMFTLFGVAAVYVLLSADFLAVSQIMIYIGGVLVLIIFGVMLTTKITGVEIRTGITGTAMTAVSAGAALAFCLILVYAITGTEWIVTEQTAETIQNANSLERLGAYLMTDYLLAFEISSVLLTIALVGAALIARRK